ncbi:MAG: dihydrofolate synthase/folylpolyglutamate synthase [Alpinimonas sp.]|jgi:dihydrofolate synthase/folylpolyglutamate synthase
MSESEEFARAADLVYQELQMRLGEGNPQPRLEPTRRVVELLGDVHRAYPVIHIAGTNGKTSTSRMIEAILRAYGLRTGLFTSPHLVSFAERILIDGEPIDDEALLTNWLDVKPYVEMVDRELEAKNELRLTYFEVLTILAYGTFADTPVDVAVVEAGLGGEWDSTNVADGVVAVFTPIAMDHMDRLGSTLDAIARTKSGIIKPSALVVSAAQHPTVLAVLEEATSLTESPFARVGHEIQLLSSTMAVGGQLISVQGIAGKYSDLFLDLFGDHQAENAALAIAAVESFLGGASVELDPDLLAEAFATVTSPGRLQLIATEPTVLVDAAHNPHGASSLAKALESYFTFDNVTAVVAILEDKDAEGILLALKPQISRLIITTAPSERTRTAANLGTIATTIFGGDNVIVEPDADVAFEMARGHAAQSPQGAVVITGSITLVGQAIARSNDTKGWTK